MALQFPGKAEFPLVQASRAVRPLKPMLPGLVNPANIYGPHTLSFGSTTSLRSRLPIFAKFDLDVVIILCNLRAGYAGTSES